MLTIEAAKAAGTVRTEGTSKIYEAPFHALFKGAGNRGEKFNRVITAPLDSLADPERAAQAAETLADPATAAAIAELTASDGQGNEPIEVEVIMSQYPVSEIPRREIDE